MHRGQGKPYISTEVKKVAQGNAFLRAGNTEVTPRMAIPLRSSGNDISRFRKYKSCSENDIFRFGNTKVAPKKTFPPPNGYGRGGESGLGQVRDSGNSSGVP
jgi:hypothetical protein